jgi:hypothetical protein
MQSNIRRIRRIFQKWGRPEILKRFLSPVFIGENRCPALAGFGAKKKRQECRISPDGAERGIRRSF